MAIEGKCDKCGFQPTLDHSCLRCVERERDELLKAADALLGKMGGPNSPILEVYHDEFLVLELLVDRVKGMDVESIEKRAEKPGCDHGVAFDREASKGLDAYEVRRRWPRLDGKCPKGCGYSGIAYASSEHYYSGDW